MGWLRRLRSTIAGSAAGDDFEEEARFHFDQLVDEYTRQGMTWDEARRNAQRRLGNLALARERTRDVDTLRWLTDLGQDVRFAGRMLSRDRGFALVAVLTLALGIGANTAIFSLFDAILLRPLPVHDPARLVLFSGDAGEGTMDGDTPTGRWELFSTEVYRTLRDQPLPFDSLTAVRSGETAVLVRVPSGGRPAPAQRGQAHLVAGNYFSTLGVQAALGRALAQRDDRSDALPVAVISDSFWREHMGANPTVIGATAILNTTAFTIVGVAPREFFGERVRRSPDFWVPLVFQPQIELEPSLLDRSDAYWLNLIGRLSSGVSRTQAEASATTVLRRLLTAKAGATLTADRQRAISESRVELTSGTAGVSGLRSRYSQPLHILLVVVGLVLLIACANVANLLLARASSRRSEMSLRMALGASRGRLVRQLLAESLLLALGGAVCGALLAKWIAGALLTFAVSATAPVAAGLSLPVLAFTSAITVSAAFLFGVAPALHTSRMDLVSAMKTRQGGGTPGGGRPLTTGALVAAQIALSLVLLVGANLFARSLVNLEQQSLGFDDSHVLLVRISPRLAGYTPAGVSGVYSRLYERLSSLPGIRSATVASYSPLGGSRRVGGGRVEAYTPQKQSDVQFESVLVGPAYPDTMGMRVLQGRAISPRDGPGGPKVAMVNESFVRRYLPQARPIGRHIGLDESKETDTEIIGVLADAQFHDPRTTVEPMVFLAMMQHATQFALSAEIAVRTTGDPTAAAAEVRAAVAEIDPNLPVEEATTLTDQVSRTFNSQRLAANFVGFFGLLALTLASVGLYGMIAQNVSKRTNEIGVRMALGADRHRVIQMIWWQTLVPLGAGLFVGVLASLLGARLISSQLFGLSPVDPFSFGTAAALLAIVAVAAGFIPARRAACIDPILALRAE